MKSIKKFVAITAIVMIISILFCGCALLEDDDRNDNGKDDDRDDRVETQEDSDDDRVTVDLSDTEWLLTIDPSCMVFENGRDFRFYRDDDVRDDYYFEGTYDLYVDEDAIEFVTEDLKEYDLTEEEINRFRIHDDGTVLTFVCLVLHNESLIIDGEENVDQPYDTPYYGIWSTDDGDDTMTLVNMNTASIEEYKKK
ncbi:MAG: hypothetical protein GXY06_03970 [Clostridiaceae bacterium]|nr:hypothetical protein [Clostridiaceae bacterium]